jgi:hypothetical protein
VFQQFNAKTLVRLNLWRDERGGWIGSIPVESMSWYWYPCGKGCRNRVLRLTESRSAHFSCQRL